MSKNVAAERAREDLLQIRLPAGHHGPIGQCDPDRGNPRSRPGGLGIGGPEVEKVAPFPRIFRAADLPGSPVHDRELPVPEQAPAGHLAGVQLLAHHGFHRVAPQRRNRTSLDLPRQGRRRTGLHGVLLKPARSPGSILTRGRSGVNASTRSPVPPLNCGVKPAFPGTEPSQAPAAATAASYRPSAAGTSCRRHAPAVNRTHAGHPRRAPRFGTACGRGCHRK